MKDRFFYLPYSYIELESSCAQSIHISSKSLKGEQPIMTISDRENMAIALHSAADSIIRRHENGQELVNYILSRYGAFSIDTLSPSHYEAAFFELDALDADL